MSGFSLQWGDVLVGFLFGVALFFGARLALRLAGRQLERLASKRETATLRLAQSALAGTKDAFLVVIAVWAGSQWLEIGARGDRIVDRVGFFVLVAQLAVWADRFAVGAILRYGESRIETGGARGAGILWMTYLVRVVLWSTAFLLVVSNLGFDVTALIAGLGIGGIAVGLAVQNILGDLFASLSIVLDKPFVVGDFIIVGDLLGTVEKIGIKTTRVRSLSGEQLIFSNSDLLTSRVRNFKRMYERRVVFGFGVVYQTSPDHLEEIPRLAKRFIEEREQTRFDRAHFKAFGASSYDFEVVYYVLSPDYAVYMDIQQAINLALVRAFAERGIQFAYPTRTLFVERGGTETAVVPPEKSTPS